MTYQRSTTASRRAEARSQTRFSHVSLWYDKPEDGSKDVERQVKRTSCKRLTAAQREAKNERTKHGRFRNMLNDVFDETPLHAAKGDS